MNLQIYFYLVYNKWNIDTRMVIRSNSNLQYAYLLMQFSLQKRANIIELKGFETMFLHVHFPLSKNSAYD